MSDNPFAKLIRSKTELDFEAQQRLANLLEPYIWIDPDSNLVVFKESAPSTTTLQQVFIFILAYKVKNLINPELSESASPSEVVEGTNLPGGTVRPKLAELTKKKLVLHSKDGYALANNLPMSEIESFLKPK